LIKKRAKPAFQNKAGATEQHGAEESNKLLCAKLAALTAENDELKKRLDDESRPIEERYREADRKIAEDYADELKRLYAFSLQWQTTFSPDTRSPEYIKRLATANAIREILTDVTTIKTAEQAKDLLARTKAALEGRPTGESGAFDLNEVLNPGELDLESLCKELGVMD